MSITIEQQIKCVAREIKMRESVYPKWVASHKMSQDAADNQIACMKAVLETLKGNDKANDLEQGSLFGGAE